MKTSTSLSFDARVGKGPLSVVEEGNREVSRHRPAPSHMAAAEEAQIGATHSDAQAQPGATITDPELRKIYGLPPLVPTAAPRKELMLSWSLSLHASETRAGTKGSSSYARKPILDGVTGSVRSGQMMALMGASGAGKSSLLDCISLRNQNFEGNVFVNGRPADKTFFGMTAYVYQDDLFYPTLTVREHLMFHANVRMDQALDGQAKTNKVNEIMLEVGLQGCADALIGGGNSLVRGISGGERKRVAVATELLSDPSILFLDEPTSGLDSFMAEAVCILLRKLADSSRTVVCVIHQPSSDIFNLFTHLCLLAKGRVAYLGELRKAVEYFASIGHPCPSTFNPADFFIEELAVVPAEYEKSMARLRVITDAYACSKLRADNDRWVDKLGYDRVHAPRKRTGIAITDYKASIQTQFWQSCRRTLLQYKREPVLTRARLVNSVLIGSLLGAVYFGQDNTMKSIQNKLGVAFIITINQSISSLFGVVQEVPRDFAVFMREYLAGANRVSTYFGGRTLSELPFQVLFPMVFGTVVYWLVGFHRDFNHFAVFCCILVLCANCAVSLGYALSAVFRNTTAAIAAGSLVLMPMCLFSGLLLDLDNVASWLKPLQYLSVIRFTYHAILSNEFANQPIDCGLDVTCPLRNGDAVLQYVGADGSEMGLNIGLLIVFIVLFRLVALGALYYHSSRFSSAA